MALKNSVVICFPYDASGEYSTLTSLANENLSALAFILSFI
jgi:hypothetical protein